MGKRKISKINVTEASRPEHLLIHNFILFNTGSNYKTVEPIIFEQLTLGLCLKGECLIKINLEEYIITENSLMIIQSNSIIEILWKSDDFELKSLFFSFDFISDFVNYPAHDLTEKINSAPILKIQYKDMLDLLDFYNLIVKLYNDINDGLIFRENMIKNILVAYLTKVASIYISANIDEIKKTSPKNDFKKVFFELVGKHHKQERTVSFYADKMHITSRSLSSIIYKTTGCTALTWINNFVITQLKVLLKTSNRTATEISEEYNFPSPSLFGRFFKKYTGMTPNEYRNNY